MVRICIRISFECFEFAFKWLESLLNGSILHSIASNLVRMLPVCIRMVRIPVEWFEFAFDCFIECFEFALESLESLSKDSNLHSNGYNPCRMVPICIRLLRMSFECFQFAFEWLESVLNGSNLHSNLV